MEEVALLAELLFCDLRPLLGVSPEVYRDSLVLFPNFRACKATS